MPKIIPLFLILALWLAPEIMAVYFIMPIWGGQEFEMFHWSYFCYNHIWFFRLLIGAIFFFFSRSLWVNTKTRWHKFCIVLFFLVYGSVVYMTNFVMRADKRYHQPIHKTLATRVGNKVPLDRLVLGVSINDEVRAYPIQYLAYHHQIVDTVGHKPLIATYCNVCRSGRVFSTQVNGKNEMFRLVGMSRYNAMFEDRTTGSWWQQATGSAIIGPMKGARLDEINCQQVTLREWFNQYPQSLVFQPDSNFVEIYTDYEDYENGRKEGTLTRYDPESWQEKSWVIGVEIGEKAIVYDWNVLKEKKHIQDTFEGVGLLLLLGEENKSFSVWNRKVGAEVLDFIRNDSTQMLMDTQTMSMWAGHGKCLEGKLKGTQLKSVKAYQEYWHSWQAFHPNSVRYDD